MKHKNISFSRIRILLLQCVLIIIISGFFSNISGQEVKLQWLGSKGPETNVGLSWGVPFHKGEVNPKEKFILTNNGDEVLPLQSWPMAYWPDGSLKWAGFSTIAGAKDGTTLLLKKGSPKKEKEKSLLVIENDSAIRVETGILECQIPKLGNKLISWLKINDKIISDGGYLVCILQEGTPTEDGPQPEKIKFISNIQKVTIEQNGPVRAVIKLEGNHLSNKGKTVFPFIVRLYFYKGLQTINMVHTILYDSDQNKEFVRGLGIVFGLPLTEELHNRHVRFSGENRGMWDEPVKPLNGRFPLIDNNNENLYEKQLKGERINNRSAFSEKQQFLIDNWASWNDFKLVQPNANGFVVQKRTNEKSAYINSGSGCRSSGMVFAGETSGGMALCIKDFWQSYPSMLEVRNAKTGNAELRAWLWSPEGEIMDMRHYDTISWGHTLLASYEDVQPGFSTPYGIGRTSEITLFASSEVPSIQALNAIAAQTNSPALLTTSPEYLHSTGVFGLWSLPDTSTKAKKWIEQKLDNAFEFYKLEVEQRNWYGFWDYGDIMHTYDQTRHVWCYDIGGFAWDNTELMPNLWFWYAYIRSGREDIFKMAEALTRHTGEIDVYHMGRFEGLGSRHNVRHWGCGAKEVRISQAALGRFYYYLTTDERTGDLMHASVEASNRAIGNIDPVRLIMEKGPYPAHARIGPDWFALAGNWMTEWERTGDTTSLNKILTGIHDLAKMPYGLYSAKDAAYGYDPKTYHLYRLDTNGIGYLHLSILMGGPEVVYELTDLLHNKQWTGLWLQFCKLYGADSSIIENEFGKAAKLGDSAAWSARMPAYYAWATNNKQYAEKAWAQLLSFRRLENGNPFTRVHYEGKDSLEPIDEIRHISTNSTAQWCLNAIELLEMVGGQIPEDNLIFNPDKKE